MFMWNINNLQKRQVIFDFRLNSPAPDTVTHQPDFNGDNTGFQGCNNGRISVRNVRFILGGVGGPK
jgi:hypothetical protein